MYRIKYRNELLDQKLIEYRACQADIEKAVRKLVTSSNQQKTARNLSKVKANFQLLDACAEELVLWGYRPIPEPIPEYDSETQVLQKEPNQEYAQFLLDKWCRTTYPSSRRRQRHIWATLQELFEIPVEPLCDDLHAYVKIHALSTAASCKQRAKQIKSLLEVLYSMNNSYLY